MPHTWQNLVVMWIPFTLTFCALCGGGTCACIAEGARGTVPGSLNDVSAMNTFAITTRMVPM